MSKTELTQIADGVFQNPDGGVVIRNSEIGEVTVGITIDKHEQILDKRIAEFKELHMRAEGAEKENLQLKLDKLNRDKNDLQNSYIETMKELAETKAMLSKYHNRVDKKKLQEALEAIEHDENLDLAAEILSDLKQEARERRKLSETLLKDLQEEEAELEYQEGIIAERQIRWLDAATHFAKSADLAPNVNRLQKASEFLWRAGDNKTALIYSQKLIDWAITHDGENSRNHASALNNHALQLRAMGELDRAKKLYEEAIEIGKVTIGDKHPEYAIRLNNLALVLQAQGELDRAKALYKEAIEIGKATIGENHPDHATRLNNLAGVHYALGELDRAKALYEEAIAIGKVTIGENHPEYAKHLNNLAGVHRSLGELDRAKELYEESLEIKRAILPANHPSINTTEDNLKILNE